MPLIKNTDVQDFVKFLVSRKVHIYHACQLQDLQSYLKLGGVASRSLLETNNASFTQFTSDQTDKYKGVWDKVFFNFSDFGFYFHNNFGNGVPNVYGPISLKFESGVLEPATDISVTLCSITDPGFDRIRDSLSCDEAKNIFAGRFLKKKADLIKLFEGAGKKITNTEVNVLYESQLGSQRATLDNLVEILVDPITVGGISLVEAVKASVSVYNPMLAEMVVARPSQRKELFDVLVKIASQARIAGWNEIDEKLFQGSHNDWLKKALDLPPSRGYLLKNYLNYLHDGTVSVLIGKDEAKRKAAI